MRLSEFIKTNHDVIVGEWVAFARTMLPWAEGMSEKDLQDHAEQLLRAVVDDMRSPQTDLEQSDKSKGLAAVRGSLAKIGQQHAAQRLQTGLDLRQLVSEYRALRASVLKLWEKDEGDAQGELTRFNEAIDESLTESTSRYTDMMNSTREQFLGILGHDLRNPLGAIIMGGNLLAASETAETAKVAERIVSSGERMSRMVNDLLDLTRTRLGNGIPIVPGRVDLERVCRHILSELRVLHPKVELRFESQGVLVGEWDGDRLAQVVSNLVSNAIQYGSPERPIVVAAHEHRHEIVLKVHNEGQPIPDIALKTMFMPMARHVPNARSDERNITGLGLGLYIAHEIVTAHGGTIDVASTATSGTTFIVTIPRRLASKIESAEQVAPARMWPVPFDGSS